MLGVALVVVVFSLVVVVVVLLAISGGRNALALTAIDICGFSLGLDMNMEPIEVPTTKARIIKANKPILALLPNRS